MKKEVKKPSKIKIDMAFEKCKGAVQELLNDYGTRIDGYLAKMVNLKKEKRFAEADRYKTKLKLVLARQARMMDLMDQIEQFGFMVDEAFANQTLYSTLGSVLDEINKVNMSPEVAKMIKGMSKFEKRFKKETTQFNNIFGSISKSIVNINNSSYEADAEIDAIVNSRLEQYDSQTTAQAEMNDDELFSLD